MTMSTPLHGQQFRMETNHNGCRSLIVDVQAVRISSKIIVILTSTIMVVVVLYVAVCVPVFSTEVMVKVHIVDLKTETIAAPISVRAYLNQSITEFKQLIAQVPYSSLLRYLQLYLLFLP